MKKEIFILLTASLVVSSCVDNEDIYKNPDNSKKDQVLTLSKYPQKVIDIETGRNRAGEKSDRRHTGSVT